MALTDARIKALKPKAARYLVTDGRGLSLMYCRAAKCHGCIAIG